MRLMSIDTADYPLKRAGPVSTGYVGTKNGFTDTGTITGQLSHAADRLTVELYGDKAASMYSLICSLDTDIRKNDRVVLADGEYTVVSVLTYETHRKAMLEKVGAYVGS